MTDTAISPLRRRMIEDMAIRQFKASTQHTYVRFVKDFSIFFGRSPNKAAFEDVRRYQLHLISRGVSPCTNHLAKSMPNWRKSPAVGVGSGFEEGQATSQMERALRRENWL
jgi:Phage integrase, N-terminal SAM-like domain